MQVLYVRKLTKSLQSGKKDSSGSPPMFASCIEQTTTNLIYAISALQCSKTFKGIGIIITYLFFYSFIFWIYLRYNSPNVDLIFQQFEVYASNTPIRVHLCQKGACQEQLKKQFFSKFFLLHQFQIKFIGGTHYVYHYPICSQCTLCLPHEDRKRV